MGAGAATRPLALALDSKSGHNVHGDIRHGQQHNRMSHDWSEAIIGARAALTCAELSILDRDPLAACTHAVKALEQVSLLLLWLSDELERDARRAVQ